MIPFHLTESNNESFPRPLTYCKKRFHIENQRLKLFFAPTSISQDVLPHAYSHSRSALLDLTNNYIHEYNILLQKAT